MEALALWASPWFCECIKCSDSENREELRFLEIVVRKMVNQWSWYGECMDVSG